jgi:hypothetical protein
MIFARRSIQGFIDGLKDVLPQDALAKLVDKLNRNDRASLDFEWEIAVLYALRRLGTIVYEAHHGGSRHPDVTFSLPDQEGIGFVADIASVSDRGLEDENPTRLFSEMLHKKARALKIPGGFQYRIEGAAIGKHYRDRKMKLAMPSRKQIPGFLEKQVVPWLKDIKARGLKEAGITIEHGLVVTYSRDAATSGSGHLSYTAAYSLTRNPLYTALKGKASQLRDSCFTGCKGIILCDGNCDVLKSRMVGPTNYSNRQIIGAFLRENSSISFVGTLWIEQTDSIFNRASYCQLVMYLFLNSGARFQLSSNLAKALQEIPTRLPRPVSDALNASYRIEEGKYGVGQSYYGGSTVSIGNSSASISISSRALLDLLAGKVDPKRFAEDHGFALPTTGKGINNPFETAERLGFTIEELVVERQSDHDDDWITFKLQRSDAATSPFRIR